MSFPGMSRIRGFNHGHEDDEISKGIQKHFRGERHPEDVEHELGLIKQLQREAQQVSEEPERQMRQQAIGDEFISNHPEFIDGEENAKTLLASLENLSYEPTLLDYEEHYERLRRRNLFKIDTNVDKQQQLEAARQRARDEFGRFKAEQLTEDQMGELSLDELRARANRQLARG